MIIQINKLIYACLRTKKRDFITHQLGNAIRYGMVQVQQVEYIKCNERQRYCVCVCVHVGEREREKNSLMYPCEDNNSLMLSEMTVTCRQLQYTSHQILPIQCNEATRMNSFQEYISQTHFFRFVISVDVSQTN